MKNTSIIFIFILMTLLVTLPTFAAEFSPLDDPVERYNFDFKEGKYKISFSHDRNYQSMNMEDIDVDIYTSLNYSLALEYNIQKGVKIRLSKNWIPEFVYNIPNLNINAAALNPGSFRSLNNWGFDCTYKADPTAHIINFSYQSFIETEKISDFPDGNETFKSTNDRFTFSYKPDISLGGFGMEVGYENSESNLHIEQNNNDKYHLTVSYEGQI